MSNSDLFDPSVTSTFGTTRSFDSSCHSCWDEYNLILSDLVQKGSGFRGRAFHHYRTTSTCLLELGSRPWVRQQNPYFLLTPS